KNPPHEAQEIRGYVLSDWSRSKANGQYGSKDIAFSAHLHLLFPTWLNLALTYRSIYEPAEIPNLEFPRWTISSAIQRAILYGPAVFFLPISGIAVRKKKEHLSFDVHRNIAPALFKALYGFQRCPKQLGHLVLSFSQVPSNS
ncbi:MAG: hypothetical protein PVG99_11055, partial [Desulfobacteraceae bacterium]